MTKKEITKLIEYINIKGHLNNDFSNYSKLYNMTTENIYGFLKKYDLRGKSVLTVAGSGDQRLNCYSLGANSVTCFDVNRLTDLHSRLKDAAIKELNYREFMEFFGIYNNMTDFLDEDIFNKLKSSLDDDVFYFYDFIVNKFQRDPRKNIYYDFDNKLDVIRNFNKYFSESDYYVLSNILDKKSYDFININIDNLSEALDGKKFDMILLSNISDYIHLLYPDNHIERYREIIDKLMGNLNLYGIMQVGYIYSRYRRGEDVSTFHLNKCRNEYFPYDEFHSMFVNSYYNDGTYDKIITYQKLK